MLISDFRNNGVITRRNYQYWSQENAREIYFQSTWGINVGPKFYEGNLQDKYRWVFWGMIYLIT